MGIIRGKGVGRVKGPRRLFYMIVGTGDKLVAGEDVIAGRDKLGERIGLFLDC